MATSDEKKNIVRRIREQILPSKDLSQLDGLYTNEYIYHGIPLIGEMTGVSAFKEMISAFSAGMPDSCETVADQIAEDDKVVTRLTGTGTHTGEVMGVPGSGKRITWTAIIITRFSDRKIAEEWVEFDALSFSQQLREQ
ncbi:MAG TPA: ester cyclase [Bryobacteraceae bacterium]|nr:ester cyclase [Bryobacteraceae bacterium]